MTRADKIKLLESWNIKLPAVCSNQKLDELIQQNRKFKHEVKNGFGKISIQFDKADETPIEVLIYQDIGVDPWNGDGFTAKDFRESLKDVPRTRSIDLRINSAGGAVWDGFAIKTLIDEWEGKKTASIDGMAASVASWLPMTCDEIRAPRHAQMFIHDAWGIVMGNAEDMRNQAVELEKTSNQIAEMYAKRTGMSVEECRSMMKASTLMTGEEAYQKGFIDRITDDEPVSNFTDEQIQNMKSKLAVLNSARQGGSQQKNKDKTMNRKQKIALLNKWGISVSKNATDKFLDDNIKALNALHMPKFKNGKDGEHSGECDCSSCNMKNMDGDGDEDDEPENAPEPDAPEEGESDAPGAPAKGTELYKKATENLKKATQGVNKFLANERKKAIQNSLNKLVEDGRIPGNSVSGWLNTALAAEENENGENPIISQLSNLPQQLPGVAPLNIDLGDPEGLPDVDRIVQNLLRPQNYFSMNRKSPESLAQRIELSQNSKKVQQLVNRLKKYNGKTPRGMISPLAEKDGGPALEGPLRQAWDSWAAGGPRNANTMSSQLLRQVILSEVMRAFRRQFASLEIFAHNFQSVPLEGTDYVEVPYYPLDTVASSEFTYAQGYQIAANAQTLYKQIFVGGIGNGVATPGSGRKYKPLQFTAYEIRRQPWLDIQKLSVMAGEQLAIDVRGDIMGANINAANFSNAIWTGAANGFDHTVVGNVLLQAAISAFWPLQGRNVVLAPSYYTNLAIDPGITPLLAIGTTDVLREGIVGGLYGFENIIHDPKIPIANFIRGGDGTVTAGTDPNLAGFMAWPSAILIATAPIMPPPGVLKKLVAYEQITDDQTGLAFTYQFFGNETANADSEIIECTYGSGLGELAAMFRLTTQGN